MSTTPSTLALTGERTLPGIRRENYWFRRHEVVYRWIADQLQAGQQVVDIGCGEGYGANLLAEAGASVNAWDYEEQAVNHVQAQYPRLNAVQTDLNPFPSGEFDLIVCLQVLEHLWNVDAFFSQAFSALRIGGRAVISTPNRLTFSPGLGRGEKPTNPFHVEEFDAAQLQDLALAAGLTNVEVLGVRHGPRLETEDVVARQIHAIVNDDWNTELDDLVASVTTSDFEIDAATDDCLDLIVVGDRE